jgi:hypothetical protein
MLSSWEPVENLAMYYIHSMQPFHLFWPHVKSGSFTKLIVCSGCGPCSSNTTCQVPRYHVLRALLITKVIKEKGVHVRNRESTYNNVVTSSENWRGNIKSTLWSHHLGNQSIVSLLEQSKISIELKLINNLSCRVEVSVVYRPEPSNVEVVHKSNPFVPTTKWYECILYCTLGANVEMAYIKFWPFWNVLQKKCKR